MPQAAIKIPCSFRFSLGQYSPRGDSRVPAKRKLLETRQHDPIGLLRSEVWRLRARTSMPLSRTRQPKLASTPSFANCLWYPRKMKTRLPAIGRIPASFQKRTTLSPGGMIGAGGGKMSSKAKPPEHSLHSMRVGFPTLGNVGNVVWTEGAAAR